MSEINNEQLNDYLRLVKQHVIGAEIVFTVYDSEGKELDVIEGAIEGGTINIDSSSNVRRTTSLTITPTKQATNLNEKSLIWLNKTVGIKLRILDQRTINTSNPRKVEFNLGKYFYQDASTSYDATSNQMSINLGDLMLKLDGTINGEIGGVLSIVYVAYDEDPGSGRPISYTSIRKAIEDTLTEKAGMDVSEFSVCDIGEYYANPKYNDNYLEYRQKYPLWDKIPYDQEFNSGCTIWDIISTLVELYPNYDASFDEDGKFIVKMIPSEEGDDIFLTNDQIKDLVISESVTTDLTKIRNICEVWGESMDVDWYTEDINKDSGGVYQVNLEGFGDYFTYSENTITDGYVSLDGEVFCAKISEEGSYIFVYRDGWYFNNALVNLSDYGLSVSRGEPVFGNTITVNVSSAYRVGYRFGLKFNSNTTSGQRLRVNSLSSIPITDESGEPVKTDFFQNLNDIQIFGLTQVPINMTYYPKYTGTSTKFVDILSELGETDLSNENQKKIASYNGYVNYDLVDETTQVYLKTLAQNNMLIKTLSYQKQLLYLGVSQAHGADVLTDGTIIKNGYKETDKDGLTKVWDKYSIEYYKHILNCDDIHLTVKKDSPFTVQKIGNRISVKSGGEFDNIRSNQLAVERAIYENWKNSRLTDNITLSTKLIPFLDVYKKITYKPHDSKEINQYMVQSVSHDLNNGTSSITLAKFSPLYLGGSGYIDKMTYQEMSGFLYNELNGNDDYFTTAYYYTISLTNGYVNNLYIDEYKDAGRTMLNSSSVFNWSGTGIYHNLFRITGGNNTADEKWTIIPTSSKLLDESTGDYLPNNVPIKYSPQTGVILKLKYEL